MSWQVQEAKQRFSEVLRAVESEGPQTITRHGREIAVVVEIQEYRGLAGAEPDFVEHRGVPERDQEDGSPRSCSMRSIADRRNGCAAGIRHSMRLGLRA